MKEIVVIIGGGIAGLEAGKQLLRLGHSPIIIEKSDRLGGHVAGWHKLFPDMTPAKEIVDELYLSTSLERGIIWSYPMASASIPDTSL